MLKCPFCNVIEDSAQHIISETKHCYFLQNEKEQEILVGCGVIVPKAHRQNVFELTLEEWQETYELLQETKKRFDELYSPQGYNIGWNTGEVGGQVIQHAHLHVIPRYSDEPYAGKGIRHWLKQKENKRIGIDIV